VLQHRPEYAETYGHDLASGAALTEDQYRAKEPAGRAILHAVDHEPGREEPDGHYPLLLTTGRTIYHFHTRTKTGRVPELHDAAPDAWVELSAPDADALGIAEGDLVRVESARGALEAPARITALRPGVVFVRFHYGDGDLACGRTTRAANELTITAWDPVSKQPLYKVAAVRVTRVAGGDGRPAPAPTAGAPARVGSEPEEA
jgi:anaerobic selenocysteine-containing dehydrogenase